MERNSVFILQTRFSAGKQVLLFCLLRSVDRLCFHRGVASSLVPALFAFSSTRILRGVKW